MALVRFRPFHEVEDIRHQMNRLFEDMLTPAQYMGNTEYSFSPLAELNESEDSFYVRLELPGLESDDIEIEASRETVSIRGERRMKDRVDRAIESEFRYGKFRRVISLPKPIDYQNIKATHRNGIVEITLPKAEPETQKVVKVKFTEKAS